MFEVILTSLSALYLTVLVRQLIDTDKKPIACDICMSLWTSLASFVLGFFTLYGQEFNFYDIEAYKPFLFVLPASGLTYILLKINETLHPKMPSLVGLRDDSDEKSSIVTR